MKAARQKYRAFDWPDIKLLRRSRIMCKDIYIVYETTNLVNGRYYVGVHKVNETSRKNYLGSGDLIKRALKKYGKDKFFREVLREFDIEDDAYAYEKEIITEYLMKSINCYNICEGGQKPPIYYGEDHYLYGKQHSEETRKKMSASAKKRIEDPKERERMRLMNIGRKASEETRKKMSENNARYWEGRHHSEETKEKIRKAKLGSHHTEETRKKMSESRSGENHHFWGKKFTEEHCRHMSESRMGFRHTPEACKKISEGNKGKVIPQDVRYKISKSLQGKNHPNSKLWIINGKVFYSAKSAAEFVGYSVATVSRICQNQQKKSIPLWYVIERKK